MSASPRAPPAAAFIRLVGRLHRPSTSAAASAASLRCPAALSRNISHQSPATTTTTTNQKHILPSPSAYHRPTIRAASIPLFSRLNSTGDRPPGYSFVRPPGAPPADPDASAPPPPPSAAPGQPGTPPPTTEEFYQRPSYELTFTCKPCGHRSTHVVTKQAYHHGTTLIRCPGCKDRHVISDHLKVFGNEPMSFEDILAGNGETIRKAIRTEEDTIEYLE
ncbi:DNL zinc finger-domain-containing protein [Peziza echinospora]|nr:DNL zinc finger-domain-containing protein [Peziza echinospora]